jgi:bacterioferritin
MDEKRAFLKDIQTIRDNARKHLDLGVSMRPGYRADREQVLELLQGALATELVCQLRYLRHFYSATGVHGETAKAEFKQHAAEEERHAMLIAERIAELGGQPNFSPDGLTDRSHSEYVEGENLFDMVKEDFVAERVAIETYSDIIRYLGDDDPTTRRMLEEILALEEEHAEDLWSLLQGLGSK